MLLKDGLSVQNNFNDSNKNIFYSEVVRIKIVYPESSSREKRSTETNEFPRKLSFKFRRNDYEVILDVEKNDYVSIPPIMVMHGSGVANSTAPIKVRIKYYPAKYY